MVRRGYMTEPKLLLDLPYEIILRSRCGINVVRFKNLWEEEHSSSDR